MHGSTRRSKREDSSVIDLADAGPDLIPLIGGKAAGLGGLIAAGLPVPPGFCITTAAYHRIAAAAEAAQLAGTSGGDPGAFADRTRESIAAVPVPEDLATAIRFAYARLGGGDGRDVPVAVRSSATAEDLPEASFAGQQDTYLNVTGADAVLDAVRRCWASLWTRRAVAYRHEHGVEQQTAGIAVIVQRMVEADISGVLFTANPLTGRRREAVIDAAPGLGDAVVSGAINPDHFVLDTASGTILERTAGTAGTATDPAPGRSLCLTDGQLRELAALGERAEQALGRPQDLEWSIDADGQVLALQSRPITTLYPVPDADLGENLSGGTRSYMNGSLMQGLTRPLTPMGCSVMEFLTVSYRAGVDRPGDPVPFRYLVVGMRLFVDVTELLRAKRSRRIIPRLMKLADARSVDVLEYLMADPRFAVARGRSGGNRLSARVVFKSLPQLAVLPYLPAAMIRPDAALERLRRAEEKFRRALVLEEPASATKRLDFVERVLGKDILPGLMMQLPPPAAGYAWLGIARWLLDGLAKPGDLEAVLRGLPGNVTTEMDLELWRTATLIRDDPDSAQEFGTGTPPELTRRYLDGSLPAAAQQGIAAFLGRYGHRAVAEIDLGVPRWAEDPSHILNVLANYLRVTDPKKTPDRQFARAEATAEERVKELSARARTKGTLRGRLVAHGLRQARQTAGLRESPKFALIMCFAEVRRQLAMVGKDLAAAGRISEPDDVFFLDLAEARVALRGADLREAVAERRHTYALEMRRRHIPRMLLSDGTDVEAALAARTPADDTLPPGTLRGAPASAGTVTGKARVILDPQGAHLEPGEILVAPSTDPGWTPLFLTAGAMVMEMGGPISHGAVVAREYGIPAVVGVPNATTRIRTGDVITVDGAAGTVRLGG
ncbi:MAG: PEP/pyruvate-binding domain-containing protein [Arthrobacter oryzae]